MPSDAWVDTTELSGEKKKEQSPDTVMEEPTEPAPGTVIAQAGQPDVEKDPSEPREETRRVVLVTMEPEESTEVIVKPPEQEPERSTEATEKPSEPVEKEKGLEMEKRESEVPKDLPEPEIFEKPFVKTEKAQEATSEQEVTFRMKAWSNWLHRQDQKDEEKRIRNRARQRALRQQRRSDRAAGLQQAVRKGPSLRRSWTVTVDDPLPKGSVQKVLKQHTKAPRRERIVKLRLIEREVQASRVTAKGEYMIQNKHRAWIAPKARPQPKSSGSRVKKEFIEIQPQRGVTMVSLTGSEASDVGDMEEIPGALPESAPTPTKGRKSMSSGLTGHERITSETIVRIGTNPQGEVEAKRQEIKPGTAYFMKRPPQEPEKVKYTSQVRSLWRPSSNAALSVTDGTSDRRGAREAVSIRASIRETGRSDRMGEGTCPPSERRGRTPKGKGAVPFREDGTSLRTWKGGPASPAGRVRERKTRSPAMEGRRRTSREFEKGKANFSRATCSATDSGRSSSDTSAKGNIGTDGDGGGESRYAARSASSAIVRGRDCIPQATAGASVQVFGQEGRREGRHDIQSVQVPPKRGVEPPIRARAHFSNPAFDVVRKKEIVCTVEPEPEFEFEYPIKLVTD